MYQDRSHHLFEEQGRQRLRLSPQEVRNGTFENNLPGQWLPNHPDQQDTPETETKPTTTNRDTNRNTDQERPKVLYLPYVWGKGSVQITRNPM